MKPSSLLGLALELVACVADSARLPADARVGQFFRARKYLGSRDRRFIGETAYCWLRRFPRHGIRWESWSERAGLRAATSIAEGIPGIEHAGELVALAREGSLAWDCVEIIQAIRDLLRERGTARAESVAGSIPGNSLLDALLEFPERAAALLPDDAWPREAEQRRAAETCLPAWLAERVLAERGESAGRLLAAALREPATVDLRVNLHRGGREAVRKALESELRQEVTATPYSPAGLRIQKRVRIEGTTPWREGLLEIEDEGSQIVVRAAGAARGRTVLDVCAGAGGKTLAFVDLLLAESSGAAAEVTAVDAAPARLRELERRARRAHVLDHVRILPLEAAAGAEEIPAADLVFIDAPCSGLGTLRRNPELKIRYGPEAIESFHRTQSEILARWSRRVKPGGHLAYATCSILRRENEDVADAFSAARTEFVRLPPAWASRHLPPAAVRNDAVCLDPVATSTDAFFLALWQRR